jgi:phage FluMu protein Com
MEYIYAGRLEIKCPKCNEVNVINFKTTRNELKKVLNYNLKGGENK